MKMPSLSEIGKGPLFENKDIMGMGEGVPRDENWAASKEAEIVNRFKSGEDGLVNKGVNLKAKMMNSKSKLQAGEMDAKTRLFGKQSFNMNFNMKMPRGGNMYNKKAEDIMGMSKSNKSSKSNYQSKVSMVMGTSSKKSGGFNVGGFDAKAKSYFSMGGGRGMKNPIQKSKMLSASGGAPKSMSEYFGGTQKPKGKVDINALIGGAKTKGMPRPQGNGGVNINTLIGGAKTKGMPRPQGSKVDIQAMIGMAKQKTIPNMRPQGNGTKAMIMGEIGTQSKINNMLGQNVAGAKNVEVLARMGMYQKPEKTAWKRVNVQNKLNLWGDADGDKVANILDCEPTNANMQGFWGNVGGTIVRAGKAVVGAGQKVGGAVGNYREARAEKKQTELEKQQIVLRDAKYQTAGQQLFPGKKEAGRAFSDVLEEKKYSGFTPEKVFETEMVEKVRKEEAEATSKIYEQEEADAARKQKLFRMQYGEGKEATKLFAAEGKQTIALQEKEEKQALAERKYADTREDTFRQHELNVRELDIKEGVPQGVTNRKIQEMRVKAGLEQRSPSEQAKYLKAVGGYYKDMQKGQADVIKAQAELTKNQRMTGMTGTGKKAKATFGDVGSTGGAPTGGVFTGGTPFGGGIGGSPMGMGMGGGLPGMGGDRFGAKGALAAFGSGGGFNQMAGNSAGLGGFNALPSTGGAGFAQMIDSRMQTGSGFHQMLGTQSQTGFHQMLGVQPPMQVTEQPAMEVPSQQPQPTMETEAPQVSDGSEMKEGVEYKRLPSGKLKNTKTGKEVKYSRGRYDKKGE